MSFVFSQNSPQALFPKKVSFILERSSTQRSCCWPCMKEKQLRQPSLQFKICCIKENWYECKTLHWKGHDSSSFFHYPELVLAKRVQERSYRLDHDARGHVGVRPRLWPDQVTLVPIQGYALVTQDFGFRCWMRVAGVCGLSHFWFFFPLLIAEHQNHTWTS